MSKSVHPPGLTIPPGADELPSDDGVPLETNRHRLEMNLLCDALERLLASRRPDYFVGGNMFVYYSIAQARDVAQGRRHFRGPDVFWVEGVESGRLRNAWVSWEEGGRLPEVVIELLSSSTASIDRNEKKDLYGRVFRTAEYFLYDPDRQELEGFGLKGQAYRPLRPDSQRRIGSERLGVSLGLWHGIVDGKEADWLRLYRPDGSLVPTSAERAEAAEAEVARLRVLLEGRGV